MEQPTPDELAKALALLAQALCAATDARVVLQSLMNNAEAIQLAGGTTPEVYRTLRATRRH